MTKVLLISQNFYPETISTGIHMTELALGLTDERVKLDAFVGSGVYNEATASDAFPGIESTINIYRTANRGAKHGSILSRSIFALSFAINSFLFVLRKGNLYDTIIFPTNPPFLYLFLLLFKKKRPQYILILYDIYPEIVFELGTISRSNFIGWLWRKLDLAAAHKADKLVVIGRDMKNLVIHKYGQGVADRISLIPNWSIDYSNSEKVSLSKFISSPGLEEKPILLYSGTMGTTHNVEDVLELAKFLPDYNFLFVGGGAKFNWVRSASDEHPNVYVEPFVPYKYVASLLHSCKASFVCLDDRFTGLSVPSKSYGIWSAGKPVIGLISPSSEIGLQIKESGSGLLLSDQNMGNNAARLREWLDQENFEQLATICTRLYTENFTYDIAMMKYKCMLQGV